VRRAQVPAPKGKPKPKIVIRHEFTGEERDEVELGLRVWAAFLGEEIRRSLIRRAKEKERPGRPV
jgi:hypothetical protein